MTKRKGSPPAVAAAVAPAVPWRNSAMRSERKKTRKPRHPNKIFMDLSQIKIILITPSTVLDAEGVLCRTKAAHPRVCKISCKIEFSHHGFVMAFFMRRKQRKASHEVGRGLQVVKPFFDVQITRCILD